MTTLLELINRFLRPISNKNYYKFLGCGCGFCRREEALTSQAQDRGSGCGGYSATPGASAFATIDGV